MLILVAMLVLIAGGAGYVVYANLAPKIIEAETESLSENATVLSSDFVEHVRTVERDLLGAAAFRAVRGIVEAESLPAPAAPTGLSGAEWRAALGQMLEGQLKAKPDYLQFRFIGVKDNGRELVRADRHVEDGSIQIVPDDLLQEKGTSDYFQQTIRLPAGKVYVSRIELNREHGEVQVPHVPVLRVATPIHDRRGALFGILIINLDARVLFSDLRQKSHNNTQLYMVNAEGDYLLHPNPARTFGFELGAAATIQSDFPAFESVLGSSSPALLETEDAAGDRLIAAIAPVRAEGIPNFTIVQTVRAIDLLGDLFSAIKMAGYAVALFVMLAVFIAIASARALTKPIKLITSAASALAEGERIPLPTRRKDEIGTLARAFDRMASDMSAQSMTLADTNKNLVLRESKMLEANRVYRGVFDSSDVAIIDKDFSGIFALVEKLKMVGYTNIRDYVRGSKTRMNEIHSLHRVNAMNAAACELLGFPLGDKVERLSDANGAGPPSWILDIADAIFEGHTRLRKEVELSGANGKVVSGLLSLLLPKSFEAAQRLPLILVDLSDVKDADLARRAKVEQSQFLHTMSHEIRTPLNAILGNLELLAQTNLESDQVELIESADKASKSLLALIGNILDFSKIEAGKLTVEIGDFVPSAVMEDAVDVLQSVARQKGTFISMYFSDDVPPLVSGDQARVRQILLNLIGNAVKFTNHGGIQVRILAKCIEAKSCILRYEIHDSGCGFDPANAEKLFEAFTQDSSNRDLISGAGLGLSICRKLVELFGGTIGCEGDLGQGSSFWFEIPTVIVNPALGSEPVNLSGTRILIVSPLGISDGYDRYFESRSAQCVLVAGQKSGLAMAVDALNRGQPYDLALLRVNLDDDWSQFAAALREQGTVAVCQVEDNSSRYRRRALRQGFPYLVDANVAVRDLDRNIRYAMGQVEMAVPEVYSQKKSEKEKLARLKDRRVLVLEDSVINQSIISKQLRSFGVNFSIAPDGRKGLEALEVEAFDLVICDCSMPVMNGFEFTRAVRRKEECAEVGDRQIIVALTANAFREDEERCIAAGMDDFISKPVTLGRLGDVLCKWLCGEVAVAPARPSHTDAKVAADDIDLRALVEILGTDDQDVHNQLLSEFVSVAQRSLSHIERAVHARDVANIISLAHRAKGDAHSMGAFRLGALYAAMEVAAKNNNTDQFDELLGRTSRAVRGVTRFVSSYVQDIAS